MTLSVILCFIMMDICRVLEEKRSYFSDFYCDDASFLLLNFEFSHAQRNRPVIIEVPHFAALRGKEREIIILRSDNGETWREHTLEATEEAVQEVLNESFDGEGEQVATFSPSILSK